MTEPELYTLLYESASQLDAVLEFWITSSFAVLLAFFFAGGKITGFLKYVILILYVLLTLYLFIRIGVAGSRIFYAANILLSMENPALPYPEGIRTASMFNAVVLYLMMIFGTFSTIYFGLNADKIIGKTRDDDA